MTSDCRSARPPWGKPGKQACQDMLHGGGSSGGLLSVLPLSTRKEKEGGCLGAVRLGPAVSLIMVQATFLEQTSLRAGVPGGVEAIDCRRS